MLGEPISAQEAERLGIVIEVVPDDELDERASAFAGQLAEGPTKSYAATNLAKAWSAGGVPAADAMMLDLTMDLYTTDDATRGFLNTAEAFDQDVEPPHMNFSGK